MRKKNILFAMNWPENSSTMSRRAEESYRQVAEVLSKDGVKCFISYPGELTGGSIGNLEKISLNPSLYSTGALGKEFCDFVEINHIAVVVFIDPSRYYRGMFIRLIRGVRFVYYSRYGFYGEWSGSKFKQLLKFLYHRLGFWSQYWAISDDIFNNLISRELVSKRKLVKIRNGVGGRQFNPALQVERPVDFPDSPFVVLYIAQLRPEKRIGFFLEVAKEFFLKGYDRSVKFVHIGGGAGASDLIQHAREIGLGDSFTFVGEKSDVVPYLKHASVYVHVSEKEGICNAISEAMLMELPVIAADIGGNREQIVNGETGYLIDKDEPSVFADKINEYYSNPVFLAKHGSAGRERILKEFSVEAQVAGIVSALNGLIGQA